MANMNVLARLTGLYSFFSNDLFLTRVTSVRFPMTRLKLSAQENVVPRS